MRACHGLDARLDPRRVDACAGDQTVGETKTPFPIIFACAGAVLSKAVAKPGLVETRRFPLCLSARLLQASSTNRDERRLDVARGLEQLLDPVDDAAVAALLWRRREP